MHTNPTLGNRTPTRQTDLNLADTANELKHYLRAAFMAAGNLDVHDDTNAIQIVLQAAEYKLAEIVGELDLRLAFARGEA